MLRIRVAAAVALIAAFSASLPNRLSAADDTSPTATVKHVGKHGRGDWRLLHSEKVQQDLKLSADQIGQIKNVANEVQKASEAMRAQFENLSGDERKAKLDELRGKFDEQQKEIAQKVAAILLTEQRDRLKQIYLQAHGAIALSQTKVADELKLTDEQKQKLKDIHDKAVKDVRELVESAHSSSELASLHDKVKSIGKESSAKAIAVLTDEQREQFEKMQGKKLDLD